MPPAKQQSKTTNLRMQQLSTVLLCVCVSFKLQEIKCFSSSITMDSRLLLAFGFIFAFGFVACVDHDIQTFGSLYRSEKSYEERRKEEKQDLSKVPGVPGVDYPLYHEVPHTNFDCGTVPAVPGMYANVETGCQAYHVCHDGREGHQGASFLCTNGTIFNQKEFACDWWYNVHCAEATNYYHLNADPDHNPYTPKKKLEDQFLIHA